MVEGEKNLSKNVSSVRGRIRLYCRWPSIRKSTI